MIVCYLNINDMDINMKSPKEKFLEHYFEFTNNRGLQYIVNSEDDFPWRLKHNTNGIIVYRGRRGFSRLKLEWSYQKKFQTEDECFEHMIKYHNRRCEHMEDWKLIK